MKNYIKYLPEFMQRFKEIKEISNAEDKIIKDEWERYKDTENSQWIDTAEERGLKRYEDMLNISGGGNSVQVRREALKVKYNNNFIYTHYTFKKYLDDICGKENYDLEIVYNKYAVNISLGLNKKFLFSILKDYVRSIIPANMEVNVRLKYNKHIMFKNIKTHRELSLYTYGDMRNTEIK